MKKVLLAAAMISFASFANAGGMSAPEIELPVEKVIEVIDTETSGSSTGGLVIPLILLALVGLAAS